MKNLKISLFLLVFTMAGFTAAQAQRVESDSPADWQMGPYHHHGEGSTGESRDVQAWIDVI
jgi:hypothetical protein